MNSLLVGTWSLISSEVKRHESRIVTWIKLSRKSRIYYIVMQCFAYWLYIYMYMFVCVCDVCVCDAYVCWYFWHPILVEMLRDAVFAFKLACVNYVIHMLFCQAELKQGGAFSSTPCEPTYTGLSRATWKKWRIKCPRWLRQRNYKNAQMPRMG